jgi:hypothetical protein
MQWILLLVIGILALVFFLRKKLLVTLAGLIQLTFFTSLALALVGIFFQAPFTALAEYSLEQNGTLTTIRSIDKNLTLEGLKESGKSLVDTIGSWFGQKDANQPTSPTNNAEGPLEKEVYPGLVSSVAGLMRGLTVVLSIVGMALAIYLSFTVSGTTEIEQLKQRITILEQRI